MNRIWIQSNATPTYYSSWWNCTISVSLLSFYLGILSGLPKGPGKVTLSRSAIVCCYYFVSLLLFSFSHLSCLGWPGNKNLGIMNLYCASASCRFYRYRLESATDIIKAACGVGTPHMGPAIVDA